ncbi:MAG: DUF5679 domain-containing protein [bacterium]
MAELKALCMKCRQKGPEQQMQVMTNVKVEQNAKGRWSAKGQCATCGGNMFKFMSEADAKTMM